MCNYYLEEREVAYSWIKPRLSRILVIVLGMLLTAGFLSYSSQSQYASATTDDKPKSKVYQVIKDGNFVYCIGDCDVGDTNIYKINLKTGKKKKIIGKVSPDEGDLSIAGGFLYFERKNALYRMNLSSDEVTKVIDFGKCNYRDSGRALESHYVETDKIYYLLDDYGEPDAPEFYESDLDGVNLTTSIIGFTPKHKHSNAKGYKVISKWKSARKNGKKGYYFSSHLKTPSKTIFLKKIWLKYRLVP